jgi:hypothetical protein
MPLSIRVPANERVRGPNLAVLVKFSDAVPMEEALLRTDKAKLVMASNQRLSKALIGSEEWRYVRNAFACWGGTMAAYERPGQRLGEEIEYKDPSTAISYIFPVPPEHQGKLNLLLVAEHPNFVIESDGKWRIVRATEVDAVADFPMTTGTWHIGDPKYDIPSGKIADGRNCNARYLKRIGKWVGLVARGDGPVTALHYRASFPLGVAVEAPAEAQNLFLQ